MKQQPDESLHLPQGLEITEEGFVRIRIGHLEMVTGHNRFYISPEVSSDQF